MGAAPAVPLPPAKSEPMFHPQPSLPVWPLKAWWLKTVSLADPGVVPHSRRWKLLEQAGCPPLLSAASSPTFPVGLTGLVCLSGIVRLKPCSVLFLSDAHVYCSLNRVWRKH